MSWVRVALNPGTGGLTRDGRAEPQTQRSHGEMEAETGGPWPHAQGRLETPDAGQGRKQPPLGPVQGAGPAPPGPQRSGLQGLRRMDF